MKRKYIVIAAGAAALVAGVVFAYRSVQAKRDEVAFQEQLRLARTEGLPTNAAEFAAAIRPASLSENAAPYYKKLRALHKDMGNPQSDDRALLLHPTKATLGLARDQLVKARIALATLDTATSLPRCWFDRNWSDGLAVLMPEYAEMKLGANLLALRGSVQLADGHPEVAIQNANEIFALSKHAGEEQTDISSNASTAIYTIGMRELATWSYLRPDLPALQVALESAISAYPKPDVAFENRNALWNNLSIIELAGTPEGRRKLGIKDEDLPTLPPVLSILLSQPKSKIQLVQAERDYHAALKLPPRERKAPLEDAAMRRNMALLAFPVAAKFHQQLMSFQDPDGDDSNLWPEADWEARKQGYTAIARALTGGRHARFIKTDDLLSPYDGKPLRYELNDKQMVVTVSRPAPAGPRTLRIPPNDRR